MLCRTENRIGQLAQAESGEQTTESRALDAELGGRPTGGLVAWDALLGFRKRGNLRDWSLSHAKLMLAKFGPIRRRFSIVIQ